MYWSLRRGGRIWRFDFICSRGAHVCIIEVSSREHMNPQLTCSQCQWLHSSVGRASHRYREVTGSNPVEVLNFFQASLRNCINCVHCDDHFFIFKIEPQHLHPDQQVQFECSASTGWPPCMPSHLHLQGCGK